MKLVQKMHSIWEGRSFLKKSLIMSLAALGILGGFFVVQVWATDTLPVTAPIAGDIWSGKHDITWDKTKCIVGRTVDIALTSSAGNTAIATGVDCSSGKYEWDTAAMTEGDGAARIFADGNGYSVFVYNTVTIFGTSGVFTLDNTAPSIEDGVITDPAANGVVGGTSKTITWNAGLISDANLAVNPISLEYSYVDEVNAIHTGTIATRVANTGSATWNLPQQVNSMFGKIKITALDEAGNANSQETSFFNIETVKPTVTSLTVIKPLIRDIVAEGDGNLTQTIAVTFSEKMTTAPTISFGAGIAPTAQDGAWDQDHVVWTQPFIFADGNQDVDGVTVTVVGALDRNGNSQVDYVSQNAFVIDTQNPTVVSATATPNPAKAGTVALQVEFSEDMDVSESPSVQVSGITTTSINVVESSFVGKIWKGNFTLVGDGANHSATIAVSGGKDLNGNAAVSKATVDAFLTDTKEPAGTVTLGQQQIGGSNLEQTVTVTFDEVMNKNVAPQLTFGTDAGAWTNATGSWDEAGTVWTQKAIVSDANVGPIQIGAMVKSATDVAGNVMGTAVGNFYVDTLNPTVVVTDNHDDNVVKQGDVVKITATFADASAIDETDKPKITIGDAVTNAEMAKVGNLVWEFSWTVPDNHNGDANITIVAKDVFGNGNAAAIAGAGGTLTYTIDNLFPELTINRLITKDTTPTLTGTVNKAATIALTVSGHDYSTTMAAAGNWSIDVTNALAADSYQLAPTATDAAGHVGTVTAADYLTIDVAAPMMSNFTTPVLDSVQTASVPLVLTVDDDYDGNDNILTYAYQIDAKGDKLPITFSSPKEGAGLTATVSNVSEGRHYIVIYAKDTAGNESNTSSQSFVVDTNHELTVGGTNADFTSIQAAVNAATAGDTISVAAGTYPEHVDIPAGKNNLKLFGATGAIVKPALSPTLNQYARNAVTINAGANGTEISGFTLDVNGEFYGINLKGATGVKIMNNTISGYGRNGIYSTGGEAIIDHNVITGSLSTTFSVDAIYTSSTKLMITNNTLTGNKFNSQTSTATGIALHTGDEATITGNTITGNSFGIQVKGGNGSDGANPIALISKNNISGNDVLNFFFEYRGIDSNYDVSENWWDSKVKSAVSSKIAKRASDTVIDLPGSITFSPWYLDEAMQILSSTDTTDPSVVVATTDADGIVKAGDKVTITATVTDANGIDGVPTISIAGGTAVPMAHVSGDVWQYVDWTAPTGDSSVAFSVTAFDAVGNDGTGSKTLVVDNTAPTFTVDDGVATGPVKADTIRITLTEDNGLGEARYGFIDGASLTDADCGDANYSTEATFTSGAAFDIAGNHTDYLCAKATDAVGNNGYKLVGKLNTDNTAPAAPVITMTDLVNAGNQTAVDITGTGEANATISYEIADKNGAKVSSTGAIGSDGNINIFAINVSTLADGQLTASVKLKDAAGNESAAGTDTATKDVVAPTITKVSSDTGNGTYTVNKVIDIDLTFSEPVKGTFHVGLNAHDGATCDIALDTLASNGTCSYKVIANDNTTKLDTTITGTGVVDGAGNAMQVLTPAFDKDIAIDTAAPSAYTVSIDQDVINSGNEHDFSFTFAGAETGATYTYTISNIIMAGGILSGTGTIATATDKISGIDVSSLADGKLNLSVALADKVGNVGAFAIDDVTKDAKIPVLAEITPVATPSAIKTPTYVFSSDEAGTITYSGSCSGNTGAVKDNNAVTFTELGDGTYADCTITVTDAAGNASATLPISTFTIDTTAPTISDKSPLAVTDSQNPVISAKFHDASAIDLSAVQVLVTGGMIAFNNDYFDITPAGIASKTTGIVLAKNTTYQVSISGLKDALGQATAETTWSFTVSSNATSSDITAPTATTFPADNATGVALDVKPVITFSERMDVETLNGNTIQVRRYDSDIKNGDANFGFSEVDGKTVVTLNMNYTLDNIQQYYFYIDGVKDMAGNEMAPWNRSNQSSHNFTAVANVSPVTTYDIALQKGWNLISLPLIPTNGNYHIGVVLMNLIENQSLQSVNYYDTATNSWLYYGQEYGPNSTFGNLDFIEDGKGYWIYMTRADTLHLSGTELPSAGNVTPLKYSVTGQKWNLIGFKSATPQIAGQYISQMGVSDVLWVFKDGKYQSLSKADVMESGFGYWFYTYAPMGFDIVPK